MAISQGLRLELSTERENVERLESEAEESKEKLKRLAKLEKNEKGHNAMTEELKKMEEETGISVRNMLMVCMVVDGIC